MRWALSLPNAADTFLPSYAAGGYLFSLSYTAAPLPLVGQTDTPLLCRVRQPPPCAADVPSPRRKAMVSPSPAEARTCNTPPRQRTNRVFALPHPVINRKKRPTKAAKKGEECLPAQCAPVRREQPDCRRPTAREWGPQCPPQCRALKKSSYRRLPPPLPIALPLSTGHDDCLGSPPRPGDRPHFIGHPVQRRTGKGGPTRDRQRGSCTGGRRPPRYAPDVRGAAEIPVPRKPAAAPLPAIAPGVQRRGAVAAAGPRCEEQRVSSLPSPLRRSPPRAGPSEGGLSKRRARSGDTPCQSACRPSFMAR